MIREREEMRANRDADPWNTKNTNRLPGSDSGADEESERGDDSGVDDDEQDIPDDTYDVDIAQAESDDEEEMAELRRAVLASKPFANLSKNTSVLDDDDGKGHVQIMKESESRHEKDEFLTENKIENEKEEKARRSDKTSDDHDNDQNDDDDDDDEVFDKIINATPMTDRTGIYSKRPI